MSVCAAVARALAGGHASRVRLERNLPSQDVVYCRLEVLREALACLAAAGK